MWVLDHLDDLESDFSAIHRVADIHALEGPRFFRMAHRINAYEGVMKMRAEEEMLQIQQIQQALQHQAPASSSPSRQSGRIERPLAAVTAAGERVVLK